MSRIAIVGSGLAGISAAKALKKRGIKPTILDVGYEIEEEIEKLVNKLGGINTSEWKQQDVEKKIYNPTLFKSKGLPKKLFFGSDYFYGSSNSFFPIKYKGSAPPLSYAKGGLSIGWGSTALPALDCDLNKWPINHLDFKKYYKKILLDLPFSAREDEISKFFPLYSENLLPLKLTKGNQEILKDYSNSSLLQENEVVLGQSRTLIRSHEDKNGCRYCGYCMSGCPYGSIYQSKQDLDKLIEKGEVDYLPNIYVESLSESNGKVQIYAFDHEGKKISFTFDRVFIAAGALNSTRLVLKTKQLYEAKVKLQTTLSVVHPFFRLKNIPLDWPIANTEPGLFLLYKEEKLSNNWIHTQLSTPNELVLQKLRYRPGKDFLNRSKEILLGRLVIAHTNIHSDFSNGYMLSLKKGHTGNDILYSEQEFLKIPSKALKLVSKRLSFLGRKMGYYKLPYSQNSINSGSYHTGGTLPMKKFPKEETETNLVGNPKGLEKIHIIDSSIFPSLPATTIGMLTMANAYRIVSEIKDI